MISDEKKELEIQAISEYSLLLSYEPFMQHIHNVKKYVVNMDGPDIEKEDVLFDIGMLKTTFFPIIFRCGDITLQDKISSMINNNQDDLIGDIMDDIVINSKNNIINLFPSSEIDNVIKNLQDSEIETLEESPVIFKDCIQVLLKCNERVIKSPIPNKYKFVIVRNINQLIRIIITPEMVVNLPTINEKIKNLIEGEKDEVDDSTE